MICTQVVCRGVFDKERTRALEENAVLKRTVERYKSSSTPGMHILFVCYKNASPVEGNQELRLQAMEQALRCPVNNQRWKTAMLLRCSHMFSRKVLYDAERSRNRKCPTCKTPFAKGIASLLFLLIKCLDDIVPIFLYQENEDDD